ncbi:hypothetical protein HYY75_12515 [bacterium]|nr:hypothetical protein [bacterium]
MITINQLKYPRVFITLFLLLTLAFTFKVTLIADYPEIFPESVLLNLHPVAVVLEAVPRQLRAFFADYLWLTADEYMHFGPSKKMKEAFFSGSYAGNTEIMPMLELALILEPEHIDAYGILSQNLSFYLGRYKEGIQVLQRGIFFNKKSPRLHELYAAIGYIYGFIKSYRNNLENNREISLRYFDAALKAYEENHGKDDPEDEVFCPRNYQIIRSRFLVEKGEKENALQAWYSSGIDLNTGSDALSLYLRKVEKGEEVPGLPEELPEIKNLLDLAYKPPLKRSPGTSEENISGAENLTSASHEDHEVHEDNRMKENTVRKRVFYQTIVLTLLAIGLSIF